MSDKNKPLIWMNVTTSANWNRPPVGIVRVEQAICHELERLYGKDRFRKCVWRDGQFVEWTGARAERTPDFDDAIDMMLPKTESFDLSRQFLFRALERFGRKKSSGGVDDGASVTLELPVAASEQYRLSPSAGDILVSIGLDWDQSYSSHFYALNKKHGVRVITCCYDLIPVLFPQYCVGDVASRFKEYFNALSWGSTAVLCISEQTRKDYLELCEKIGSPMRPAHVIPLGDNVPSGRGGVGAEVQAVLRKPFILFVSTIERRKNHEVLYRAYHQLCREGHADRLPKLVFVGMPGWGVGDLLKDIELDPLTQDLIVQLNHVSDEELMQLYRNTLFFAYPSLYEGWGLPVGEALAMGKAVLSSDQGSLPEVGGDLVRYLPAWDVRAWADAILDWCTSPDAIARIEQRVKREYRVRTWADTGKVVKKVIDQILAEDDSRSIVIYPGHDCSTQIGTHVGSALRGSGKEGFLMFGPHNAIASGKYKVRLFGMADPDNDANLLIDFVGGGGQQNFWRGEVAFPKSLDESEVMVVEFDIDVGRAVDDFELRCIDRGSFAKLTKLEISRSRTGHTH
ncbi:MULTISPECIES: glycosyltransferase family 1 protein [unclassified Burkholderia]|uniref:glycosyltransferase family 4 protein n=1 Tax=unclassified Burkholderia TaxID=2613784 RepID=UPI0004685B9C|nr:MULTISPECIES: glycosyltransferase family 1 protein [unclassified Burkholderia]NIE83743.1 glycosyltransferase family 4 protein [Burkholderia sp. Tr-860]NIF62348.1 glycosyltransferase family 4 protein [Burkholderia sp. Cy-647]NIF70257.1 glycosyltransferase family 4 protein [Burkholderia sp. Ap-962]NIF96317.1 glycosyltransferase family 4 protein [Burkholderia sp. Ax-1720]